MTHQEGKKAPALFDAHCHLDWEADPAAVARACGQRGVALACCTVTPPAFLAARGALAAAPNVVLGVGAHPWWVADGRVGQTDVGLAAKLAAEVSLVGEVGLDFSPARSDAAGNQAVLHTTILSDTPTSATISGRDATLYIDGPFFMPGPFTVTRHRGHPDDPGRVLRYDENPGGQADGLHYAAAEAARLIADGRTESEIHPLRYAISTLEVADEIRRQLG